MTQEFDILVNRLKEQHACQTIRQQWSESAHCASGGGGGVGGQKCSRRVARVNVLFCVESL